MAPKFISFPIFAIFLFTCLSLLACASPIPIVLPPSEGVTLFRDVVAREVDVLRREAAPLLELHKATGVLARDEDTGVIVEPSVLADDPGGDLEERICRYGCL
ncbi:hypothetical protein BDR07DRAFT_1479927 [Suillus spraguei]|nr:hypothetical protein BDR07DRAFT_1479927 [Suillus spraguei]